MSDVTPIATADSVASSLPSSILCLPQSKLKEELVAIGCDVGPITPQTVGAYRRYLYKLKRQAADPPQKTGDAPFLLGVWKLFWSTVIVGLHIDLGDTLSWFCGALINTA